MSENVHEHGCAAQYVEVQEDSVGIVDKDLIDHSRQLVAVVGPPGAGKSTLCNTLYHIAFGSNQTFFEPSANPTSFTKGLWLLSHAARKMLPADVRWEVVDMEGFQVDQMSSWKMAMVLCVLAEICVFCNRDARCDNLFKAAIVFERGRKLAFQLGMKPITTQIFVQVEEGMEEDLRNTVVQKIQEMIPNVEIVPFEIPQIRNKNKKNHEFITFHEEIKEAVEDSLIKKFHFEKTVDRAADKSQAVSDLLNAFNEGDYLKTDLNSELLRADLERIYESELAVAKNVHTKKAFAATFRGVDMTLDEYIGEIPKFEPDYTSSTFYQEGKSEKFVADFASIQPSFDYRKIYEFYFTQKMDEAKQRIEREREVNIQEEKDYHADIERALELSQFNVQRHVSTLAFSMSLTKAADDFIENKAALEERGKKYNHKPDWSPYYKYYEHEKQCVKGMWDAQINRSKWLCPVSAQGKLKCKNGHKINEDIVFCKAQLDKPDAKGKLVCGGTWYWVDGPLRWAICRGACGQVQKLPTNLSCFKCSAEALCEIRPSNFFP